MSEQPPIAEKDAGLIRTALREHAPLPGLPLFCGCGHQATTPYSRETHLVDVLMAPQTSDPDVAPADVVPAASVSGSASEDTTPSGSEPDTRPASPGGSDA